jgi:hypothetical protein
MLVYFKAIWYILWPFGICNGYLVHFSCLGMLYQEKSGNPGKGDSFLSMVPMVCFRKLEKQKNDAF